MEKQSNSKKIDREIKIPHCSIPNVLKLDTATTMSPVHSQNFSPSPTQFSVVRALGVCVEEFSLILGIDANDEIYAKSHRVKGNDGIGN